MMRVIDVYAYRRWNYSYQYLLLKRAQNKSYSGQWRMIGGKIQSAETAWKAGLRELKEETGIEPLSYWTVPSVNHFYDYEEDHIYNIPVFAAEIDTDATVQLNEEHTTYRWVTSDAIPDFVYWPEQRRLLALINDILIHNHILPEWKIPF